MTGLLRGGRAERRAAVIFLAPAITLIVVFFLLPVIGAVFLSITDFDIYSVGDPKNTRIVALENYRALLKNPVFWQAVRNTLYFTVAGVPLTILLALAAALLLNAKVARFKPLFRTIFFAPVVTTIVAVAVVWKYLYHPRVGLLNMMLDKVGVDAIDWLGDPLWAMPAIILLAVWKNFGYSAVIFLAALQDVPEELYEAAEIDGAGAISKFRHVTLPSLAPAFLFVGVITAIGYVQLFAEPYVMTPDGGPLNSTLSVVMLMYREGFRWWNMGQAASIAFFLFALTIVWRVIPLLFRRKGVRA